MLTYVTCPTCLHQLALPEGGAGKRHMCPKCQSLFQAGGSESPPAAGAPLNKTMMAPLETPIRYSCPRCKKPLEDPASAAGTKKPCPGCGQRIQVPAAPPPAPGINKTMLGQDSFSIPVPEAPPEAPPRAPREPARREPARTERCLECGRDVTSFEDVFRCPDCGALFCSAACNRDHRRHAHEGGRRERAPVERPPEPDNTGLVVGLTLGGVFLLIILFVVFFLLAVRW